jgi:hypothetical protein
MKLKIQSGKEIPGVVRPRQKIRSWTQCQPGTKLSLRSLALTEPTKPAPRQID